MAIQGVDTKCYILALFVRDDGERFLLGSGHYEFKDTQMHFAANAIQNDIVEVQGNDGFLLAGQVRRPGTQSFDGYVGDGTMSKEETESYRRQFFSFFRKNFFYKVIYVFSDGTAIQRKSGFLVDDPTVEELYQMYPEYHVALNFEDVNYYSYSEDEEGQEQYAKEATIDTSSMRATGGLVWDNLGVVWEATQWGGEQTASGTEMTIQNEMDVRSIVDDIRLDGDTYQQTYSGKNKVDLVGTTIHGVTGENNGDGTVTISGTATNTGGYGVLGSNQVLPAGTYTLSISKPLPFLINFSVAGGVAFRMPAGSTSVTITLAQSYSNGSLFMVMTSGTTYNETFGIQLVSGSTPDYDFEPYVGGIPAPNPDYPQDVQTVTGEQTVTISNGSQSQEYEINLGKNLFDKDNPNLFIGYFDGGVQNPSLNYASGNRNRVLWLECKPNTTYSISFENMDSLNPPQVGTTSELPADGIAVSKLGNFSSGSMKLENLTTTSEARYLVIRFQTTAGSININDVLPTALSGLQIELGPTSTSYSPYFTPIELCKIGDYQDYIYKSDDDWYVHKECMNRVLDGSSEWGVQQYGGYTYISGFNQHYFDDASTDASNITVKSNQFTPISWNNRTLNPRNSIYINLAAPSRPRLEIRNVEWASVADVVAWFTAHPANIYYALATPTDTKITDDTLIGQLNALGAMRLFIGENNLIVQAAGTNLPAPLSFKYYTTVAMTGAEWEEGGSGGATVVEVDSITNTYPIWRVKGPAVNPQLSVINTNTTVRYTGTVTSTQTLEIDMFNKTAKLNGVSVIGNVSGDWVSLAPGTNRVIYTAENADAQPSTIEWQEVVG